MSSVKSVSRRFPYKRCFMLTHLENFRNEALEIYQKLTKNEIIIDEHTHVIGGMNCKIDGLVFCPDKTLLKVECPLDLVSEFKIKSEIQAECQITMQMLDFKKCHYISYYRPLAYQNPDNISFRYKEILRDDEWFKRMTPQIKKFLSSK